MSASHPRWLNIGVAGSPVVTAAVQVLPPREAGKETVMVVLWPIDPAVTANVAEELPKGMVTVAGTVPPAGFDDVSTAFFQRCQSRERALDVGVTCRDVADERGA